MKERIKFKTLSGSTYIVDRETMRWYRISNHDIVGDPGNYYTYELKVWPVIELDEPVNLIDKVSQGGIWTTPVVSIERTHVELPDGVG